jgi:hypothetical protein
MSLESKIDNLTAEVSALRSVMITLVQQLQAAPVAAPQPAQAVVPQQPAFSPSPAPSPAMVVPPTPVPDAAPQMPPTPTFMAPPAAAAPAVPFADTKGLIGYMTEAYGLLGPEKGAQMQNVLTSLGYQNVNDVQPAHFPAVYQQIEALKAQ